MFYLKIRLTIDEVYVIMLAVCLFYGSREKRTSTNEIIKRREVSKACNGVCAFKSKCKHCGEPFIRKNTPVKNEIKNWKELESGQQIKIIQGTGPYYICSTASDEYNAGEKVYMGCKGI